MKNVKRNKIISFPFEFSRNYNLLNVFKYFMKLIICFLAKEVSIYSFYFIFISSLSFIIYFIAFLLLRQFFFNLISNSYYIIQFFLLIKLIWKGKKSQIQSKWKLFNSWKSHSSFFIFLLNVIQYFYINSLYIHNLSTFI